MQVELHPPSWEKSIAETSTRSSYEEMLHKRVHYGVICQSYLSLFCGVEAQIARLVVMQCVSLKLGTLAGPSTFHEWHYSALREG